MAEQATDWIEWAGGDCPLPNTRVEVRFRDGKPFPAINSDLRDWGHYPHTSNADVRGAESDIIAYRVVPA